MYTPIYRIDWAINKRGGEKKKKPAGRVAGAGDVRDERDLFYLGFITLSPVNLVFARARVAPVGFEPSALETPRLSRSN